MRHSRITPIMIILAVMTLGFVAKAQDGTRAAPSYDNFASAKAITVGKSYITKDIGAATTEVSEPISTCPFGLVSNSVWFSVTLPYSSNVYMSTMGSYLDNGTIQTGDTTIAVYVGNTLPTLTTVVCNDDNGSMFSEVSFIATAGTTYYIAVGTFDTGDFTENSFVKLNTLVKSAPIAIDNFDFEAPLTAGDWKLKNGSGDGRICGNVDYPSASGSCVFLFVGNAGESSKLTQTFPMPTYFVPRKSAAISIVLDYRAFNTTGLGNTKVTYSVLYSDGTPPSKITLVLTGSTPGSWRNVRGLFYLKSAKVSQFTIQVTFKSTSGELALDGASAYYSSAAGVRAPDVLPLPASVK